MRVSRMSRASYAEKKSVFEFLRKDLLRGHRHIEDVEFHEGEVRQYYKSLRPWDDVNYTVLTTDPAKIPFYQLLVKLNEELDEGRQHERQLEQKEMYAKIEALLKSYSSEELKE